MTAPESLLRSSSNKHKLILLHPLSQQKYDCAEFITKYIKIHTCQIWKNSRPIVGKPKRRSRDNTVEHKITMFSHALFLCQTSAAFSHNTHTHTE